MLVPYFAPNLVTIIKLQKQQFMMPIKENFSLLCFSVSGYYMAFRFCSAFGCRVWLSDNIANRWRFSDSLN